MARSVGRGSLLPQPREWESVKISFWRIYFCWDLKKGNSKTNRRRDIPGGGTSFSKGRRGLITVIGTNLTRR